VTLALVILGIFAIMAVLMYLNRLPALIALPIMAVAIALAARLPWRDLASVVSDGSVLLYKAYTAAMLGAVLAEIISKTGIAETMVKKAAELGGDRPLVLSLVLTAVVAVLFTTLGGLGAVIMVATIVFPILLALGLRPLVVGGLFLFGLSIGGIFNLTNWQVYLDVLRLSKGQIFSFAIPFAGVMVAAVVAFALIETRPSRMRRFWAATRPTEQTSFAPWYSLLTPLVPLIPILGFALYNLGWSLAATNVAAHAAPIPVAIAALWIFLPRQRNPVHRALFVAVSLLAMAVWVVLLICLYIPVLLAVLVPRPNPIDFPIITAMLLGICYGLLTARRPAQGRIQLLARSAVDGIAAVAPAVVLMLGIGMLVTAVMHPQVQAQVMPVLRVILPHGPVMYVVVFSVLAPLALYRGPLNLYGLGAGLSAMMAAAPGLGPARVMAALLSVGQVQGVCDPTNTHNVWIANYLGVDVQQILRRSIVYVWPAVVVGLVVAAAMFARH